MSSRLPPHLAAFARAPAQGRGAASAPGDAGPSAPADPAAREGARFAGVAIGAEALTGHARTAATAMARIGGEVADMACRSVERNLRSWERIAASRNPVEAAAACLDAWLTAAAQCAAEAATLARLGWPGAAEEGGEGAARADAARPAGKPRVDWSPPDAAGRDRSERNGAGARGRGR